MAQFSIFWTSGQICTATSRLLVEAAIAKEFFAKLKVLSLLSVCVDLF